MKLVIWSFLSGPFIMAIFTPGITRLEEDSQARPPDPATPVTANEATSCLSNADKETGYLGD